MKRRYVNRTGSAHQFVFIVAFPRGNGELQQVDVQNTHVVWVTHSHGNALHDTGPASGFYGHGRTSPQVHGVGVTFVREVEGGIIQDESGQDQNKP